MIHFLAGNLMAQWKRMIGWPLRGNTVLVMNRKSGTNFYCPTPSLSLESGITSAAFSVRRERF
jgi:hypothetical protein